MLEYPAFNLMCNAWRIEKARFMQVITHTSHTLMQVHLSGLLLQSTAPTPIPRWHFQNLQGLTTIFSKIAPSTTTRHDMVLTTFKQSRRYYPGNLLKPSQTNVQRRFGTQLLRKVFCPVSVSETSLCKKAGMASWEEICEE